MVDPVTRARIWHRVLFVGIAALVLVFRLLPLTPSTTILSVGDAFLQGAGDLPWPLTQEVRVPNNAGFSGPDLSLALILAWVLRRPEYVPASLILLVVITENILFQSPPGLWPLIVLWATEALRVREDRFRGLPFIFEFGLVALTLLAMVVVQRVVLFLTVVPQPALGAELLNMLYTLAIYPVVVLASALLLGIKRPAPGEVDELGHPL
jgi:rod shape-determining protein MreD